MNAAKRAEIEATPFPLREAYERGFRHGSTKLDAEKRKLETMRNDRDRWQKKYKSETQQHLKTINELRKYVAPEFWALVTQGHYEATP